MAWRLPTNVSLEECASDGEVAEKGRGSKRGRKDEDGGKSEGTGSGSKKTAKAKHGKSIESVARLTLANTAAIHDLQAKMRSARTSSSPMPPAEQIGDQEPHRDSQEGGPRSQEGTDSRAGGLGLSRGSS